MDALEFVLLLVDSNHCSKKNCEPGQPNDSGYFSLQLFAQCFLVFLKKKKKNLCAVYKDFRVLLTILATNTNNLDNHNLYFLSLSPREVSSHQL